MDSQVSTKTEGSGSDPKDKGSLDKHSKEKQRSPSILTAESHDDSEKSDASGSEVGGPSPPLPVSPGLAALGSVLQSKQDPYFVLDHVTAEHIGATRQEMKTAVDIMLPLVGPRMGSMVARAIHSFLVRQGIRDASSPVGNSDIRSFEFWGALYEFAEYAQLGQEQNEKETIASREAMGALGILHGVLSILQWFIVQRLEKFVGEWEPGLKPAVALFAGAIYKGAVKERPSSTVLNTVQEKLSAAQRLFMEENDVVELEDDLAELPTAAMLFWLIKNLQSWAAREYFENEFSTEMKKGCHLNFDIFSGNFYCTPRENIPQKTRDAMLGRRAYPLEAVVIALGVKALREGDEDSVVFPQMEQKDGAWIPNFSLSSTLAPASAALSLGESTTVAPLPKEDEIAGPSADVGANAEEFLVMDSPPTKKESLIKHSKNKGGRVKHSTELIRGRQGNLATPTEESHDNFPAKAMSNRGVSKKRSQDDSAKTGWAKLGIHATTKKLDSKRSSRLPCSQVDTGWGRFGIQSQARHDPFFGMQHTEGEFREKRANAITCMLPLMGNRMGELIAISFNNFCAEKVGKFGGGAVWGSSELADSTTT